MRLRLSLILKQLSLATFGQVMLGTAAFAMCCGFLPPSPSRNLAPADNTKTLVVYANGIQHLIVQPEFIGSLEDFALVMPAPSRPSVKEAPIDLFTKLEDLTNPLIERTNFLADGISSGLESAGADSAEPPVRVLDRSDVGQYTVTILSATDGQELRKWLNDNGYETDDTREEIIDYYVETNGFFVALKVNMAEIAGSSKSKLDPIDISYETNAPRIPTRLLAANPQALDYVVYVLAPEPYIIPGADVQFSKKIGLSKSLYDKNTKVLLQYNPLNQWLVRNKITISPDLAKQDLFLERIADSGSSVVSGVTRENVNAGLHQANTGVVRSCSVDQPVYPGSDFAEFYEKFKDRLNQTISFRFTDEYDELSDDDKALYSRWVTAYRSYGTIYQDDQGYYYISDRNQIVEPDQCDESFNFDLAVGEPKTRGGWPLYRLMQAALIIVVLGLAYYLLRRFRRYGFKKIVPNPFRAAKNGAKWLDAKTNHRLFGGSDESPKYKGYKNSIVSIVGISLWIIIGNTITDISRRDQSGWEWNVLIISFFAIMALTLAQVIFTLFIKSTAIQVRFGWRELRAYLGSVIVITLLYALIVYSILN